MNVCTIKAIDIYRIRRSDGMFSMGGTTPRFNKKGKIWRGMGSLKNHLNIVCHIDKVYKECEVIEYLLTENEVSHYPLKDVLSVHRAKQMQEETKRKIHHLQDELIKTRERDEEIRKALKQLSNEGIEL